MQIKLAPPVGFGRHRRQRRESKRLAELHHWSALPSVWFFGGL